jgi:hypothetical protein
MKAVIDINGNIRELEVSDDMQFIDIPIVNPPRCTPSNSSVPRKQEAFNIVRVYKVKDNFFSNNRVNQYPVFALWPYPRYNIYVDYPELSNRKVFFIRTNTIFSKWMVFLMGIIS